MIDYRQIFEIEDKTGEMLECECSIYTPEQHLKGVRETEVKLRFVTFPTRYGQSGGVKVYGGADHARFLSIMREDRDFSNHLNWTEIEEACCAEYMRSKRLETILEAAL